MDFPASHVEGNQRIRRLSRRNLGLAEQRMVLHRFHSSRQTGLGFSARVYNPLKLPQIKKK